LHNITPEPDGSPAIVVYRFPWDIPLHVGIDIIYAVAAADDATITEVSFSINGGEKEYIFLAGGDGIEAKGTLGEAGVLLVRGENNIVFTAKDSEGRTGSFHVANRPYFEPSGWPRRNSNYIKNLSGPGGRFATDRIIVMAKIGVRASQVEDAIISIDGIIIGRCRLGLMHGIEVPVNTEEGLRDLCAYLMASYPDIFSSASLSTGYRMSPPGPSYLQMILRISVILIIFWGAMLFSFFTKHE